MEGQQEEDMQYVLYVILTSTQETKKAREKRARSTPWGSGYRFVQFVAV
jgi:hypothetical protein